MRSILLVDDEPIICTAIEGALVRFGIQVQSAHDVEKALNVVRRSKFDAILLEFNLKSRRKPRLRTGAGLSLIPRLRSWANTAPILMLTDMAGEPYRTAAFDAGAADVIQKADGIAFVVGRLRTVFGQECLTDRVRSGSK